MNTLLYNKKTGQAGPIRIGKYMVDGKPGILPEDIVELEVEETPMPAYDIETQKIEMTEYVADLQNKKWKNGYRIIEKSEEEISQYQKDKETLQKNTQYEELIQLGYQIPNTDIYLSIGDSDRIAWNQLLTLINEMLNSNLASVDNVITIVDNKGVSYPFTIGQVKMILAGLGYYYYTLWIMKNT